jgi:NHL repeat
VTAAATLTTAAALAVLAWAWWRAPARLPPPLEPNWPAVVRTLAGNSTGVAADGALSVAGFGEPFGVAVSPGGVIYVSDGGAHRVRRITVDGRV